MFIDTDKYVSAVTAARMLGVTDTRISALIRANRFKDTIRLGHARLISRAEIEKFERLPPGAKKKADSQELVMKALQENVKQSH